jgi:hypothetical protein
LAGDNSITAEFHNLRIRAVKGNWEIEAGLDPFCITLLQSQYDYFTGSHSRFVLAHHGDSFIRDEWDAALEALSVRLDFPPYDQRPPLSSELAALLKERFMWALVPAYSGHGECFGDVPDNKVSYCN